MGGRAIAAFPQGSTVTALRRAARWAGTARFTISARRWVWRAMGFLPAREVTVATAAGRFTFDTRDRIIGEMLYAERAYEPELMDAAIGRLHSLGLLPQPGRGAVLDVGGHVGMSAIALVAAGVFGRAAVFEPSPANFRLLQKNVRQNGLADSIVTHNLALSEHDGEVALELNPQNFGDNRVRGGAGHAGEGPPVDRQPGQPGQGEEGWQTMPVAARTLDGLFGQGGAAPPAAALGLPPEAVELVWLDIQGHEGAFLRGARGFFSAHPQVPVFTEFWPYGLARSAGGQGGFFGIVTELFSHFCPFEDWQAPPRPVAELPPFFQRYGQLYSHMLFLNP